MEAKDLLPSAKDWAQVSALAILLVCIAIPCVILIANIIFLPRAKKKSNTNKLILSQTFIDLLVALLFIPVTIVYYVHPSNTVNQLLAHAICYTLLLSLTSLQALAWHRCRSVKNPIRKYTEAKRQTDFSATLVNKIIACIWIIPFVFSLVPLTWLDASVEVRMTAKRIFSFALWGTLSLSFLHMVGTYVYIIVKLRSYTKGVSQIKSTRVREKQLSLDALPVPGTKQCATNVFNVSNLSVDEITQCDELRIKRTRSKKQERDKKREMRMTKLLGALLLTFFLSYFPIIYINSIDLFGFNVKVPTWLHIASLYTFVLNSFTNPILFIFMKRDLRRHFRRRCQLVFHTCCRYTSDDIDIEMQDGRNI